MTLIELMWAMVIFAFVATATVAALEMSMKTVRSDRSRVAASDLAARELEIVAQHVHRQRHRAGQRGGRARTPTRCPAGRPASRSSSTTSRTR